MSAVNSVMMMTMMITQICRDRVH